MGVRRVHSDRSPCHDVVNYKLAFNCRVLHQDRCVLHDPFAVHEVECFGAVEAVSKFKVSTSVINRNLVFTVPLSPFGKTHELAVRAEANTLRWQQFWAFDVRDCC